MPRNPKTKVAKKKAAPARKAKPGRAAQPKPKPKPAASSGRAAKGGEPGFGPVFERLRGLVTPFAPLFSVKDDGPTGYTLVSRKPYQGKELWFGGVRLGKAYVSFHLFPVYMNPRLLAGMSAALRKRMQGKSCFNFTQVDDVLLGELGELVEKCVAFYRSGGMI